MLLHDYVHKGKNYKNIVIENTSSVLKQEQIDDLKDRLGQEGDCVNNAVLTAKEADSKCIEGFVFCMLANGDVEDKVIRHCWNRKDEKYFDITADFVWPKLPGDAKQFFYYIISEHSADEYIPTATDQFTFLSDAVTIAKEIDEIWQIEAKR